MKERCRRQRREAQRLPDGRHWLWCRDLPDCRELPAAVRSRLAAVSGCAVLAAGLVPSFAARHLILLLRRRIRDTRRHAGRDNPNDQKQGDRSIPEPHWIECERFASNCQLIRLETSANRVVAAPDNRPMRQNRPLTALDFVSKSGVYTTICRETGSWRDRQSADWHRLAHLGGVNLRTVGATNGRACWRSRQPVVTPPQH